MSFSEAELNLVEPEKESLHDVQTRRLNSLQFDTLS
jgi:hypothetical protein